jgi:hypothetical protein
LKSCRKKFPHDGPDFANIAENVKSFIKSKGLFSRRGHRGRREIQCKEPKSLNRQGAKGAKVFLILNSGDLSFPWRPWRLRGEQGFSLGC